MTTNVTVEIVKGSSDKPWIVGCKLKHNLKPDAHPTEFEKCYQIDAVATLQEVLITIPEAFTNAPLI